VMNRGVDHAPIFYDDSDRIEFGQRLADIHDRFGVDIHAYCLMDNHFHLLVHCPEAGLSAAMQRLTSLYTRHVNDRLGRDGPLMRGRFHSKLVDDESYLVLVCRYIHRNPLDRVDVDDVAAYRWSSHRTYLGHRSRPPWMQTSTVLGRFGGDVDAFDAFVRSDAVPGSRCWSAGEIAGLLGVAEHVVGEHAMMSGIHAGGLARTVTLLALDRIGGCSDADLLVGLDMPSASALRAARWRACTAVDADPELAAVVGMLISVVAVGVGERDGMFAGGLTPGERVTR